MCVGFLTLFNLNFMTLSMHAREGLLQLREEVPAALDDLLLDAVEHEGLEVEHLHGRG